MKHRTTGCLNNFFFYKVCKILLMPKPVIFSEIPAFKTRFQVSREPIS
jgi:hypothetical protein